MGNPITQDKIVKERKRFIDSINHDEVCRLASSLHGATPCKIFQPVKHGAFNACFFVEFQQLPGSKVPERWVVRIPIPIRASLIGEKMEVELATMRYVSAKTTIPIPKVHAYSTTADNLIGMPFIVMDYVEGQTLKDLGFRRGKHWVELYDRSPTEATKHLHRQLADVHIQLRRLEFPRIGALGVPSGTGSLITTDPDDIQVCNRPLSLEMALQEAEGFDPSALVKPKKTYSTAREFVDALMWLADNKLDKNPDLLLDEKEAMSVLYAAHHFKQFINDEWLRDAANDGPFVLMHGDMNVHQGNILFDDKYNIVAVLDWEWSMIVPAQLLVPPIWLTGTTVDTVVFMTRTFKQEVERLRAAIRDREMALRLPPKLSDEWAPPLDTGESSPIVCGLLHPEKAYNVYWDLIFGAQFPITGGMTDADIMERYCKVVFPRTSQFVESSEDRKAFLARKKKEQIEFFEAEKEYFDLPFTREIMNELPERYNVTEGGSLTPSD